VSTRRELIANALRKRFIELCSDRLSHFGQSKFTGAERYVSEVREQFRDAQPGKIKNCFYAPGTWMTSDTDCLTSLKSLSLGQPLQCHPGQAPTGSFITILSEARDDPEASFRLLVERYACPLNFTLPGEVVVREYVLTRLMVHARAKIEKQGVAAGNNEGLLLKLNLVAVNAALTTDLRFVDALNYYYELLPSTWYPTSRHNWLLVSYLALHARALVYLSEAITECA
jgi:hypothetical protein